MKIMALRSLLLLVLLMISVSCATLARAVGGPDAVASKPPSLPPSSTIVKPKSSSSLPIQRSSPSARLDSPTAPTSIVFDTGVWQEILAYVDRDNYLAIGCDDHEVFIPAQLALDLLKAWALKKESRKRVE